MSKPLLKSSYELANTIESVYTGGKVRISSDYSKVFSTLGEDILVTDFKTGKKLATLHGDSEIVTTFAIKPDGKHLVSASRSLHLKVWCLETYKVVKSFKAQDSPVIVMEFDPTSTLVALGSADSSVKVYDIDGGYCTHNLKGHSGVISSLKFHKPSLKYNSDTHINNQIWLASGSLDCSIKLWDLATSKCKFTFTNHNSVIRGIDFNLDGSIMISGSRDKIVNVWNTKSFKLIKSLPVYETLENVGFIPNGFMSSKLQSHLKKNNLFFTAGEFGILKIWDTSSGNLVYEQSVKSIKPHPFTDAFVCGDLNHMVTITDDHNITIYDTSKELIQIKHIIGYTDEIVDVKYIGNDDDKMDGQYLAVASNSEQIRVYDVNNLNCTIVDGHTDIAICLATRKSDQLFASGSKDHTARIWQLKTNLNGLPTIKCIALCKGHAESVGAIALATSSNLLITGSQDRTIKMWDFSSVTSEENELYQPKSTYTFQAHDKDINSVTFSPSDKLFATGSQDKTAKIWNTEDGKLKGTLTGHKRGVWSVNFSPTDPVLATSSGDKTIKLWSCTDFSCLRTFEGHTNSVLNVNFLNSGLQLVSCGSDGLVKLWTIKSNQCIETLDNHDEKVWSLTKNWSESNMVSGGADAKISFWNDVTQQKIDEKREKEEELVLKEQELSNFMKRKDYDKAIELCLGLDYPKKLLGLLIEIADQNEINTITGSKMVDNLFINLTQDKLVKVLSYVKEWNTNNKFSKVAQNVLHLILKYRDANTLSEIENIKQTLTALLPYTQRHYQKVEDLITQTYLLDYALLGMDQL